MSRTIDNRKSIKVNSDIHKILKEYCYENGLKIDWFISKLIKENCIYKNKSDIDEK